MNDRSSLWTFIDGAASLSLSMLVCLIIQSNQIFAEIWGIHFIKELTHQNDGLMAATILLLFPAAGTLYGSIKMFFAAREAVRRKSRERDERMREEGREQGSERTRARILNVLERRGIELPPDVKDELVNCSRSKPDW